MANEKSEEITARGHKPFEQLIIDLAQHRVLVNNLVDRVEAMSELTKSVRELRDNYNRLADSIQDVALEHEALARRVDVIEKRCENCPENRK